MDQSSLRNAINQALPRYYLINLRLVKQLALDDISLHLDISKRYYQQLESGARGVKMGAILAFQLIKLFDVDGNWFLEQEIQYVTQLVLKKRAR